MAIRERDKFQIQLTSPSFEFICAKCNEIINPLEDDECVILWGAHDESWKFHIICYGDVVGGMVEFFKVFILKQEKPKIVH